MQIQSFAKRSILSPNSLIIANADVVSPREILADASVTIRDGVITDIGKYRNSTEYGTLNARGLILLPGFVDIHSDAVESAIQPRPGGYFPISMALRELDRSLVAFGITTMFHSLSFCDNLQTELRNSHNCADLIRQINREASFLKANTKIHLRYEITETYAIPLVEKLIQEGQVHFFSIMDHTPGQGQFVDEEQFRIYYGKVRGKTPEELDKLIFDRKKARLFVEETQLKYLTDLCHRHGIQVASHDDDTLSKVEWNYSLGVRLAEFPVTMEAARKAREFGMHVSLGAPNILRGGSATGNLSARDAIAKGYGTIICSDYAPVSMIHAGHALEQQGIIDMVQMSKMLSRNPAEAVGISDTIGSIEVGKRADLVLVDFSQGLPIIQRTFVDGKQVYASC